MARSKKYAKFKRNTKKRNIKKKSRIPKKSKKIKKMKGGGCPSGILKIKEKKVFSLKEIKRDKYKECNKITSLECNDLKYLETIGSEAFYNCQGLTKVNLERLPQLETISSKAFSKCIKLKTIELKQLPKLIRIENEAFSDCTNLESFIFTEPTYTFKMPRELIIQPKAFFNCRNLKKIIFYKCENLSYIGEDQFSRCDSLETIEFDGCGLYKISKTFSGLQNLNKLILKNRVPLFFNQKKYDLIIEKEAFKDCTNLKNVVIEKYGSDLYFGEGSFHNCGFKHLINDSIYTGSPDNFVIVTQSLPTREDKSINLTLDEGVFKSCVNLTNVDLNNTLIHSVDQNYPDDTIPNFLPSSTFVNCKKLINFECLLNIIGDYAFYNCESLTQYDFTGIEESIGIEAFYNTGMKKIDLNPKKIGDRAFSNCMGLTDIIFNNTKNYRRHLNIGKQAFSDCTSLVNIQSSENLVLSISRESFYNCEALEKLVLLNVEKIESDAFSKCKELKDLTINIDNLKVKTVKPESSTRVVYEGIEMNAFQNITNLTLISQKINELKTYDDYEQQKIISNIFNNKKITNSNPKNNPNINYINNYIVNRIHGRAFGLISAELNKKIKEIFSGISDVPTNGRLSISIP